MLQRHTDIILNMSWCEEGRDLAKRLAGHADRPAQGTSTSRTQRDPLRAESGYCLVKSVEVEDLIEQRRIPGEQTRDST